MSEKFRVDNTDKWKMHAAKKYHAEISYHGKDFFVLFLAFIPVSYYFYVRLILEKTCKSVFYLRYVFFFFHQEALASLILLIIYSLRDLATKR